MTLGCRVVGLGQDALGDDGAGLEVVRLLRAAPDAKLRGVEYVEARDPSDLVALVEGPRRVAIVDAAVGAGALGEIIEIGPEALGRVRGRPASAHGMDVVDAIELGRAVHGAGMAPEVRLFAIAIGPGGSWGEGLSPAIRAAVPRAARAVRAWLDRRAIT